MFPYTDRNPSAATFERDFLEQAVLEQGLSILGVLEEKQIVIDGRKLRDTAPREKGPKDDCPLKIFVTENSLFIGQ
ncbi:MAG: hypothetical protein K2L00_00090 [Muribaculaceae bacterium]|nr:hypothetical protein [Muribaculaceae bacterium]